MSSLQKGLQEQRRFSDSRFFDRELYGTMIGRRYEGDTKEMEYQIRKAKQSDLAALADVEACCFPVSEAASKEAIQKRLETFGDCFFVAEMPHGEVIGFINGCVTDRTTICDEMFADVTYHSPEGAYQSVFGLDVLPQYQRRGIAADLMEHLIADAWKRGKKGMILTCKERLIPYYERFGYRNLGKSQSVHGGAIWYDMLLERGEAID